jgi:hypothetical protein
MFYDRFGFRGYLCLIARAFRIMKRGNASVRRPHLDIRSFFATVTSGSTAGGTGF